MRPEWQCDSHDSFRHRVRCQQVTGHEGNHFNDYYCLEWEDAVSLEKTCP
jgi:hypothetical protein